MYKYIIIVDPYSSGALLAPRFSSDGYKCIAVHSQKNIPAIYSRSFKQSDFDDEIYFSSQDKSKIISNLKKLNCVAVLPGTESGVELSDMIAYELNLPHNNLKLSAARRNKLLMQNCLEKAGLKYIKSEAISSLDNLLNVIKNFNYPVIIKPINSAGSDDIYKCETLDEAIIACEKVLKKINALGIYNDKVILQEYIVGKEFVIDAVSCEGIHHTTNGCLYTKVSANGSDVVYKKMDFISPLSSDLQELIAYNDKVLDALEIKYGPSHSEIMLTDSGPVLIEVGARIHGGGTPKTIAELSTLSQLDLLLPSYLGLEYFKKKIYEESAEFTKYGCVYFFISQKNGLVKEINFETLIYNLESFYNLVLNVSPGTEIQKTVSLNTSPGWVVLVNDNKHILERDLRILENIDIDQMFII